jgi:excisionase family DNA binding protein
MDDLDLYVPTPEEAAEADAALHLLADAHLTVVTPDGAHAVELPHEALRLLRQVLVHIAEGHAVAIQATKPEVTPQQAAELLHVSEGYVHQLVEDGKLPCRKVGIRRWIPLQELLTYRAAVRARSRELLDQLTQEAQELGLG